MAITGDRAAKLLETGLGLASELSLEALLTLIVTHAVDLTGARYGALGVLSQDKSHLDDFITVGVSASQRGAIGDLPHGRGILGVLISDPRPLRLRDIRTDNRAVGFPRNHPPMKSFLGAPVCAHGDVFGNIYLADKRTAGEFSDADETALVVLASQAGVAVSNARLFREVRRHEEWLDAVRAVATGLLAGRELPAVLHVVTERARRLVEADVATLSTPVDGQLRIVAADGTAADELMGVEVPYEGSLSARVLAKRQTMLIGDASTSALLQPIGRVAGVGPMVLVPLTMRSGQLGVLATGRVSTGRAFDAADVPLLESFAEQAAVAIEYARTQQDLARLQLADDRERIARDLHDGIIQSLFAVGLSLQGTATAAADARLSDRIQRAVTEIDVVIGDLRSYIFGLRPALLGEGSLTNALDQLAHEFQERTPIATVVDVDGTLEAPLAAVATHVVQIVREALSNVGRHAGGETCRVSVRRDADAALIEVDDDGSGFDPGDVTPGMGLNNLMSRAQSLGGTLDVDSRPGEGTQIRIRLPLPTESRDRADT